VGDRLHGGLRPVGRAIQALLTEDAAFRILVRIVAAIAVIVVIVLLIRALT
jgi:hypothetical protein